MGGSAVRLIGTRPDESNRGREMSTAKHGWMGGVEQPRFVEGTCHSENSKHALEATHDSERLSKSQRMDVDVEGTHVYDSESLSKPPRMDVSLWGGLPEHLAEKFVSRLPIRDIFRFRAVCDRWNSLVNCPSLLKAREDVPSERPWFLVIITDGADDKVVPTAAYDPSVNKWHWMWQPTLGKVEHLRYMSSDGGLICYYDRDDRVVLVLNPLTKAYRRLPKAPMVDSDTLIWVDSICLVADPASRSYQVFLIARFKNETTHTDPDCSNVVLEAYHSSSDSWYRMGNKSPPLSITGNVSRRSVLHAGGFLHMLGGLFGLLVFSLDEHVWRRIEVPFLRSVSGDQMVQWQERLLIIAGRAVINDNGSWKRALGDGICVWELHRASSNWVIVDSMPDNLFQEVAHRDEGQLVELIVISVADCSLVLVIVARYNRDETPTASVTSFKTVLYDLEKQEWTMVEPCPLYSGLEYVDVEAIGYTPRLDAMYGLG